MKKILVLLVFSIIASSVFAQYSRPYRVAYNAEKKSYLVTNRGDGKVLELDSNYKLSTVITGLVDPKDLVVGNVGGNKGLLVIDDNKIVVYDASGYNKIISFNIAKLSWSEYEDIEMDPRDPRYFYLSDVGAGRIIKGKVGPPPFYTPTYTTLVSTGLNRPKGLLFNSKNELLVVTDDSLAKVVKIDTASGKLTTVFTPGVDSLNSITQDNEGNYFITNWEDSYLYRCDKDFKNLTKLTGYNKPAGMAVNTELDLLIVLCHFCNKMEFHKLHYVEPNSGAGGCPGDSIEVNVSVTAEGVGTYNSGNAFEVELSNASGSFAKPTTIGKVTSTDKPKYIKCLIPGDASGNGYKIRIKSTSPSFYSSEESISVFNKPDLSSVVENWSLCKGSTIEIGRSSAADESYHWKNGGLLSDSTISNPSFTASDTGYYAWTLTATDTIYQCKSEVEVQINVNPDIQLENLNRNVELCAGDSVHLGVSNSPYTFTWFPVSGLSRTDTPNPRFVGSSNQTYTIKVGDLKTGCRGIDSVNVKVNPLPDIVVEDSPYSLCAGSDINLNVTTTTGVQFLWSPSLGLSGVNQQSPLFYSEKDGEYVYTVQVTDRYNCKISATVQVVNNALPTGALTEIGGAGNQTEGFEISADGNMNGSAYCVLRLVSRSGQPHAIDTFYQLPIGGYKLGVAWKDTAFTEGYLQFVSDSGCVQNSDTLTMLWLSVKDVFVTGIEVYPNPTSATIHVQTGGVFVTSIVVTSLNGVVLDEQHQLLPSSMHSVDLSRYQNGVYILHFTDELGLHYQQKVVKLE